MVRNPYAFTTMICFCLVALHFGIQPMLSNSLISPRCSKTNIVIMTEVVKFATILFLLFLEKPTVRSKIIQAWNISSSFQCAALPAALFALQNVLVQFGFVLLDPVTFNLLCQTKIIFTAVWLYVIFGACQSLVQILALCVLCVAAMLFNLKLSPLPGNQEEEDSMRNYQLGVLLVLACAVLTGLSGALAQKAFHGKHKRHHLVLSLELAVYGIMVLLCSRCVSSQLESQILGVVEPITLYAAIPILSQALGGIGCGYIAQNAGGIAKSFALVVGLMITCGLQWFTGERAFQCKDIVAAVLVIAGILLHAKYPLPRRNRGYSTSSESGDVSPRTPASNESCSQEDSSISDLAHSLAPALSGSTDTLFVGRCSFSATATGMRRLVEERSLDTKLD